MPRRGRSRRHPRRPVRTCGSRSLRRHDPDQVPRSESGRVAAAVLPLSPVGLPCGRHQPTPTRYGDAMPGLSGDQIRRRLADARLYLCTPMRPDLTEFADAALAGRSEERRVGKEWRSWWWSYRLWRNELYDFVGFST